MSDRLAMSFSSLFAALVPVLCGLVGVLVSSLPISLTGGAIPPPMLGFMPVYFWCLVRPDLMPPAAAFIVGVAQDLFSGSPPGLWTVGFVVTYVLLDRQRDTLASLAGLGAILGFALAMLVASGVVFSVAWLYFGHLPPLAPLALQMGVSVLCYVPVLPFLNGVQHRIVGPLRSEFF